MAEQCRRFPRLRSPARASHPYDRERQTDRLRHGRRRGSSTHRSLTPTANAAGVTTSATPHGADPHPRNRHQHIRSRRSRFARPRSMRPGPRTVTRPAYVCKTEAIASVTHDGSIVDLSDGKRYQLGDPVDRAQAGGWSTGTSVAECAWPSAMNRAASLDVNGYTVHALPAAIVAVAPTSTANPATSAPACADASITEVADDGYGVALSDGHVYAVDNAGHVTASAWLVGDAVTVCSAPARGIKRVHGRTIRRGGRRRADPFARLERVDTDALRRPPDLRPRGRRLARRLQRRSFVPGRQFVRTFHRRRMVGRGARHGVHQSGRGHRERHACARIARRGRRSRGLTRRADSRPAA